MANTPYVDRDSTFPTTGPTGAEHNPVTGVRHGVDDSPAPTRPGAGPLRRLLAVTHEATITGAPMNLLHLLTWIQDHTSIETHLVVMHDGPLRHRFERVTEVTVLDRSSLQRGMSVAERGLRQLGSRRAWKPVAVARLLPQLRKLSGFDVIYLNSLTSLTIAEHLPPALAVVSHVHELQVALRQLPPHERSLLEQLPDGWIAASDAVRRMLVDEVGLPEARVRLHHEYIDPAPFVGVATDAREVERLRASIGIPPDASIVMGAGTVEWRKGPELFVQLATECRRRSREPVHFVWVGGDLTGNDWQRVRSDIERAGADLVHFVGVKPDPLDWFSLADVFALTSHEDPFPLVCLEHALMGHPVVTYRNGGMPELLSAAGPEAAAGVVDHLDVAALADRVLELLASDPLLRTVGAQLRQHVLDHHVVDVAAPRLLADLEEVLRTGRHPGVPA
jgi:glycosyltransferase involved in cell wall biosynthesis